LQTAVIADQNGGKMQGSGEISKIVQSFPSYKAPEKDKLHMAVVKDALPCNYSTGVDRNHQYVSSDIRFSLCLEGV